jgi:hypothetical protein
VRGKSTLVAIVEQLPAVFGARAHDLFLRQVFDTAPPVTLTDGLAAAHRGRG